MRGTTKVRYGLPHDVHLIEVPFLPTPLPGVIIIGPAPITGMFWLTHIRSGLGIVSAPHPEALAAAIPVLAQVDWTRPATEINFDPVVLDVIDEARNALGIIVPYAAPVCSSDLEDLS